MRPIILKLGIAFAAVLLVFGLSGRLAPQAAARSFCFAPCHDNGGGGRHVRPQRPRHDVYRPPRRHDFRRDDRRQWHRNDIRPRREMVRPQRRLDFRHQWRRDDIRPRREYRRPWQPDTIRPRREMRRYQWRDDTRRRNDWRNNRQNRDWRWYDSRNGGGDTYIYRDSGANGVLAATAGAFLGDAIYGLFTSTPAQMDLTNVGYQPPDVFPPAPPPPVAQTKVVNNITVVGKGGAGGSGGSATATVTGGGVPPADTVIVTEPAPLPPAPATAAPAVILSCPLGQLGIINDGKLKCYQPVN